MFEYLYKFYDVMDDNLYVTENIFHASKYAKQFTKAWISLEFYCPIFYDTWFLQITLTVYIF